MIEEIKVKLKKLDDWADAQPTWVKKMIIGLLITWVIVIGSALVIGGGIFVVSMLVDFAWWKVPVMLVLVSIFGALFGLFIEDIK